MLNLVTVNFFLSMFVVIHSSNILLAFLLLFFISFLIIELLAFMLNNHKFLRKKVNGHEIQE